MFEKSIAALRTAFPDQRVVVAFIGGTIKERNAFGMRGLINFQNVERLNIEDVAELKSAVRGRTLAGAVLFGLDPSVADNMRSIQNAVSTAANLLGCSTQDLIHDEYVKQNSAKINPPLVGFFRHTDGGMYEVLMTANSSADVSAVVVYKHWWPFLPSVWTRPLSEWHDRFTPITIEEYGDAVFAMNVEQGRELVTARRRARKALEKAAALVSSSRPSVKPSPNITEHRLGSVLEKLEDRPVHIGHSLYDAKGNRWIAIAEGEGRCAFHLTLAEPAGPKPWPPLSWHANQFTDEGVQQLYWDNPQEGLELCWLPCVVGTMPGWKVATTEGEIKVHRTNGGAWSVVLPEASGIQYDKFETANKAERAVEKYLTALEGKDPK